MARRGSDFGSLNDLSEDRDEALDSSSRGSEMKAFNLTQMPRFAR